MSQAEAGVKAHSPRPVLEGSGSEGSFPFYTWFVGGVHVLPNPAPFPWHPALAPLSGLGPSAPVS